MSGKRRRRQQELELPKVVLDTGALIALDQYQPGERMRALVVASEREGRRLHIPAVVVAEWWRGDNLAHHRSGEMFKVEPVTDTIARSAGLALKDVSKDRRITAPLTIDAIVMATAASPGAVVYTSDFDDLDRFTRVYPGVRLFTV
jgi:predicted nucleic acid-binding protein